jgi:tRNA pseudouridine55 synthase
MDGVLIIDKPAGPTSHDVVARIKKLLGARKVGHLGTLDPAASGVLPLVIDGATRFADELKGGEKIYEFDLVLGTKTDTDDDQGRVVASAEVPADASAKVKCVLDKFIGEKLQVPPAYSAVKTGGKRSYKNARKGMQVELAPRAVCIEKLELVGLDPDADGRMRMRLHCGSGTYVRALCRDIGEDLGCFGHASNIRRLRSGRYSIEEAIPLDAFARLSGAGRVSSIKPLTFKTISW